MLVRRHPDVAQPGDADTTEWSGSPTQDCPARRLGYLCTRLSHTTGQHVAGTGLVVAAVWDGDGGPLRECWCPVSGGERVLDVDCPSHGVALLVRDDYAGPPV